MRTLEYDISGSGKLIVVRDGVVRAERADNNMLLNGFFAKMLSLQPHLQVRASLKAGSGLSDSVATMTSLESALALTSGSWPTALLTPDGIAEVVQDRLVVNGYFNMSFEVGQLVGVLVEYGLDLNSATLPQNHDVDTRLLLKSEAGVAAPLTLTAADQVLVSYKLTLSIPLSQPNVTFPVQYGDRVENHQARMVLGAKGTILDYINILGAAPYNGVNADILISPDEPIMPLAQFVPTYVQNVGKAKLNVTENGVHIPVTLGQSAGFDTGIRTIYTSVANPWYYLVVSPPIQKSQQESLKFAISMGEYEPVDDGGVVVKPKAKHWKLGYSSGGIYLGRPTALKFAPVNENDDIQLVITVLSHTPDFSSLAAPIWSETDQFIASKLNLPWASGYYVGFGWANEDGAYGSFDDYAAKYDFFLETICSTGSSICQITKVDGNYKFTNVTDAANPVDVTPTTFVNTAINDGNWDYRGEGFYYFFSDPVSVLGLPTTRNSDWFGKSLPQNDFRLLYGNVQVTLKAIPKGGNNHAPVSVTTNIYATADISEANKWAYDESLGKFLISQPYDSRNMQVIDDTDIQVGIGFYHEKPSDIKLTGEVIDNDKCNITISDPSERVRVDFAVCATENVYDVFNVLDVNDVYFVVRIQDNQGAAVTLKATRDQLGMVKLFNVLDKNEYSELAEPLEYQALQSGKGFTASFYIDEWLAKRVYNLDTNAKLLHGRRQSGVFEFTAYVKPKDNNSQRSIVITKVLSIY